jgi:hypothetical protein
MNRQTWIFKLLIINTGKIVTKEVIGFDTYKEAEECAKSLVPMPCIVYSYM